MINRRLEWHVVEGGFSESYRVRAADWHAAILFDLQVAGVLPNGSTPGRVAVSDVEPWAPGGGEVYICGIDVVDLDGPVETRHVACKAVVSGAGGLSARADEWVARARKLHALGVTTGTYGQHQAVIYQDWMPDRLVDLLRDTGRAIHFARALQRLVVQLGKGGFSPLSVLLDLRAKKDRIALTDLGYDLGPPGYEDTSERIGRLLLDELHQHLDFKPARDFLVEAINDTIDTEVAQ